MSNSAINQGVLQAKINNVQNQADSSAVYSAGAWSFKNASAVTSVQIDNSGNVGVGTTSPLGKFNAVSGANFFSTAPDSYTSAVIGPRSINDSICSFLLSYGTSGTYLTNFWKLDSSSDTFSVWQNANQRMTIDASGNLAIAGTASTGKITITQNTQSAYQPGLSFYFSATSYWNIVNGASSRLYFGFANGVGGYTDKAYVEPSTGAWTPVSDERAKKNIETISYGLNDILQLNPVKYNMNEEDENTQKHLGFIAQEVKQVIAEAVTIPEDEERLLGLDKTTLIPVLVKAIQELSAKVDAQAEEIKALKAS